MIMQNIIGDLLNRAESINYGSVSLTIIFHAGKAKRYEVEVRESKIIEGVDNEI